MPPPFSTNTAPRPGLLASLTYWLLLGLGFGALAPSVLLPEWRAYQAIHAAEQIQQARTDRLAAMVDRQRRALQRLQRDPAAMARLAQRALRYRRVDHRPVRVADLEALGGAVSFDAVDVLAAPEPERPVPIEPVKPPAWLADRLGALPDYDYEGVFCDPQTRPIILTLSVGLIGLAFVLFGRRCPAPDLS